MDELSNYELVREKNFKELQDFLSTFDDSELKDFIRHEEKQHLKHNIKKPQVKRKYDNTVRFSTIIPTEKRKSARLLNKPPTYNYKDLQDEECSDNDSDVENLENVIFPKRRKISHGIRATPFVIVPVEDVTDLYIENVAKRATIKKYSINGTSCHQCRQKTLDSKTYCRNSSCIGVRGQFCGPCLSNRYGEDATKALKDPNWKCPPCRGICNCSICRTREGKRPTGILAPLAFKYGHNSVMEFLMSLKGKGDFKEKNQRKTVEIISVESDDEGQLLGFNADGQPVMFKKQDCDVEEIDLIGFKNGAPVSIVEYKLIKEGND